MQPSGFELCPGHTVEYRVGVEFALPISASYSTSQLRILQVDQSMIRAPCNVALLICRLHTHRAAEVNRLRRPKVGTIWGS